MKKKAVKTAYPYQAESYHSSTKIHGYAAHGSSRYGTGTQQERCFDSILKKNQKFVDFATKIQKFCNSKLGKYPN